MDIQNKWLPKQWRFLQSQKREMLYSGGYGSGKTRVLCRKILTHAMLLNNLVGLCRKTFASMRQTTLRTLLYPDGVLPPILPPGTYTHQKQEHLITLNDGGSIYYFGLDDPLKAGSLNLGAVGIDEAIELTEPDYIMLLGRLRNTADDCRQIFGACNPGAPTHFLYKRFFESQNPKCEAITTSSLENVFLPTDYLESLSEFTGQNRDRYVLGKWVAFEGLVYDQWDQAVFVDYDAQFIPETVYAGVDKGYPSPSAIVVIGIDKNGKPRILDEFYQSKTLDTSLIVQAQALAKRWNIELFMIDPSCAEVIQKFNLAGLPARAANNSVQAGINCVASYLRVLGDGKPYMTVNPACVNLIKEFSAYRWKDKGIKEEPVKEADHALDALRYGMMYVDSILNAGQVVISVDSKQPRVASGGAVEIGDMYIDDDEAEEAGLVVEDVPEIDGAWVKL